MAEEPLVRELESDKSTSLVFIQGKVPFHPPDGFQDYFGPGPHWNFLKGGNGFKMAMQERIRDFPEADSPEDAMRQLLKGDTLKNDSVPAAIKDIYNEIERNGDVGGIIGYSEGALVAATFLVDQERQFRQHGRPRQIKMCLMFTGWPAIDPSGKGLLLADEVEERIMVPSIHVIGSSDPFLPGAMALSALFDEDTAILFDHGKGHTIPRDSQTVKELADTIRDTMQKACEGSEE